MRLALACVLLLVAGGRAQTPPLPPVTQTIVAEASQVPWPGWAKSEDSIPGWGNTPPEPGTVTVTRAEPGEPRTFSGRVDGLASFTGVEVGVISLTYICWNQPEAFHWTPVAGDGSFTVSDARYPGENKTVVLRAPGHPWTYLSYIFKAPEGGRDIRLHAEPGKEVRLTVSVGNAPLKNFGVECFTLNRAWIHANNPLGYQWSSRQRPAPAADGQLVLTLPSAPMALYVSAAGGASAWEIVDASKFDALHFVLLPEARFAPRLVRSGAPVAQAGVLIGNDNAALSLHGGETDAAGTFHAAGLAPGKWWLTVGQRTVEFHLEPKQTLTAALDLATGKFLTGP